MPPVQINRKDFIRLATLIGVGGAAVYLNHALQPFGLTRAAGWMLTGEIRRRSGKPSIVGLGRCEEYHQQEIYECLRELWEISDMPDVSGKRVLIKPNHIDIVEPHPVTTAPQVIGAVVDLLRDLGAEEIVVGEGSGFRRDLGSVADASGLTSVLEKRKIPLVDLNYDDPRPLHTRGNWFLDLDRIWFPRHVRNADLIISVPKLKTHHWTGVSLSLKNLFGTVPGSRYGWPKNILHFNRIPLSILGVYRSLPKTVSIVDGIIGMEGDGPLFGTPVDHGLLAMGQDPVAVDSVCAQLMGFSVDEIEYLYLANWAGVGQGEKVITTGVSPESITIPYEKAPKI